jgi:hypothetical protein
MLYQGTAVADGTARALVAATGAHTELGRRARSVGFARGFLRPCARAIASSNPPFEETTARAIESCEAAWDFFGGVFKVIIPDNTKAIIVSADPLAPRITPASLEYAQARHFSIDPARVRQPHGLFGLRVAQANPSATVYGTDWADVLKVAVENASALGVADRYYTIRGSAFDVDLGTGYDLVLVPNFLHHFDAATNTSLRSKLRRAMTPGGTIAIVEFVPNEDRMSPPIAAAFSMQMLGATDNGEAFTFSDLDAMLADAGFSNRRAKPLTPTPQTLVTAVA